MFAVSAHRLLAAAHAPAEHAPVGSSVVECVCGGGSGSS